MLKLMADCDGVCCFVVEGAALVLLVHWQDGENVRHGEQEVAHGPPHARLDQARRADGDALVAVVLVHVLVLPLVVSHYKGPQKRGFDGSRNVAVEG